MSLSIIPTELQFEVLGFFDPLSLNNLQVVSKSEKLLVDAFRRFVLKKEGEDLAQNISDYLIVAQKRYEELCLGNEEVMASDKNYNLLLSIFSRYRAKCEKFGVHYQITLPSVREDSFGLLFSICDQNSLRRIDQKSFHHNCSRHWGIMPNCYELINEERVLRQYNGMAIARVYNAAIMGEFVEKFLEAVL